MQGGGGRGRRKEGIHSRARFPAVSAGSPVRQPVKSQVPRLASQANQSISTRDPCLVTCTRCRAPRTISDRIREDHEHRRSTRRADAATPPPHVDRLGRAVSRRDRVTLRHPRTALSRRRTSARQCHEAGYTTRSPNTSAACRSAGSSRVSTREPARRSWIVARSNSVTFAHNASQVDHQRSPAASG